MPAPQRLLQFGMLDKQPSGNIAFEDLDHIGDKELRLAIQKQMYMVRHHFHRKDAEIIFPLHITQKLFDSFIDPVLQNRLTIFSCPHDMILKGIYVTATMCYFFRFR